MTTKEIGKKLADYCRAGDYVKAIDELYADDAEGHENYLAGAKMNGKAAIRGGTEHWLAVNTLENNVVDEPLYCGNQFVVRFTGKMVKKDGSGEQAYEEVGLYTVKDGKISRQDFFYEHPDVPAANEDQA